MAAPNEEIARRENGQTILRSTGFRARWELSLTSTDGHSLRGAFSATIRPLPQPAEKTLFAEAFLGTAPSVTAGAVGDYFAGRIEVEASRYCGGVEAQSLLAEAGRAALAAKLAEAGKAVAFGCGVELLPPLELDLDCPTLRAQQEESRRTASQGERVKRASEIFRQFQQIRASAPELGPQKILEQLGAAGAEQAEVLRSLLMASAAGKPQQPLWAVAGPHLIFMAPGEKPTPQLLAVPESLGPLRSVQRANFDGRQVLLLGARSGVIVVDPDQPQHATAYGDPAITSQLGFNAAAVCGGRIWATHGEAGVLAWDMSNVEKPAISLQAISLPRNLTALDEGRLVFSSNQDLFEITGDGPPRLAPPAGPAPIVAILKESPATLIVVHEDGELIRRDRGTLAVLYRTRRTGRLTAASLLPWLDSTRVLLAPESGSMIAVSLDDELVGQYASSNIGLRQVTAGVDRIAAVSPDRQRIIFWQTWDGRAPSAELHIAALARHRVADIE